MAAPCLCKDPSCPLRAPPGDHGLFSDKTRDFLRDPLLFVEAQCQRLHSRVFLTRILLRQTLVIADHALLTQFLQNNLADFTNGLQSNMSDLFGHNIMFSSPEEALQMRAVLQPLFSGEGSSLKHQSDLGDLLRTWRDSIDCSKTVNFYEEFKKLSFEYNLEVFMGVERKEDEKFFEEVSDLAMTHWHGVMAAPYSSALPVWGSSGYGRALDAKERLLRIIEERLENNDSDFFTEFKSCNGSVMDTETLLNHMLLFSCAIIPKGVAAVLSMMLELLPKWQHLLSPEGTLEQDTLDCVLLEVLRMYPPFTGGVRLAIRDTQVGPHHLPSGSVVYYSLLAAGRDTGVFLHPEQFLPGRWRKEEDRSKCLGFSTGPHDCIGRYFTMACLRQMARFVLENFQISPPASCPPAFKQLPVLRPKEPHAFTVTKKF